MQQQRPMKIFAVDSNLFSLMILQQQLRNMQYEDISLFDLSTKCMSNLKEKPDVILVYYRIKPDNGLELLQQLKQKYPDIYVVFIASFNDVQVAMQSLQYGAFDYILKGKSAINRIGQVLKRIEKTEAYISDTRRDYSKWHWIQS
jgi:DNA-binding NtrC family response regulator